LKAHVTISVVSDLKLTLEIFLLNLSVGSPVTKGDRNCIVTQPGLAGHAVYGPYQRLPVGRYAVEFNIAAAAGQRFDDEGVCAVVDVASEFGQSIATSQQVLLSQLRDGMLSIRLDFTVTRPGTFEFRIAVSGSASLLIEDVPPISTYLDANSLPDQYSQVLSKKQAFKIAYGRPPSAAEMERLLIFGIEDADNDAAQIRSVIACFEGYRFPTALSVRLTESDLQCVECGTFKLVIDRWDVALGRNLIFGQEYDPHLSSFLKRVVKPGMTAVDIGANVGFITMLLGELVGKNGCVLAFEPNPENCRLLLLSIEKNGFDHVKLFPFALSETIGAAYFYSAHGSNGGVWPKADRVLIKPNSYVVPTMRLDKVCYEQIDFIKIDVEGAEYLALTGAEEIIRRFRPIIVSEFCPGMLEPVSGISGPEFLHWMKSFGYRGYVLGRAGAPAEEIGDVSKFLAEWGSNHRIEDLAFIRQESQFDPRF
jgi:FkbM family methyltransferase